MRATSNRKLAEALGVSETAVRKALAAGRISRDPAGGFDVAKVKRQWAGNTDAAQQRPTPQAGPGLRPVPAAALESLRETLRGALAPGSTRPAPRRLPAHQRRAARNNSYSNSGSFRSRTTASQGSPSASTATWTTEPEMPLTSSKSSLLTL